MARETFNLQRDFITNRPKVKNRLTPQFTHSRRPGAAPPLTHEWPPARKHFTPQPRPAH